MNIISNIKHRVNKSIKETSGNIYNELEEYSNISDNDIKLILDNDNYKIQKNNNKNDDVDNNSENNEYKEIEFFKSNDGKQKSIYDLLSNNLSITSKHYLVKLLSNHITDIKELQKRQMLITNINSNIDIVELIESNKKIEKSVYWFIKPHNPELAEMLNSIYFTRVANIIDLKKLNDTKDFMNYYYTFLMIISPLWGIFSPIFFFIIPYFFSKYYLKMPINFNSYLKTLKGTLFGDNIFNTIKGILMLFIAKKMSGGNGNDNNNGGNNNGGNNGDSNSNKPKISFLNKLVFLVVGLLYSLVSSPYIKYVYFIFVVVGYLWSLLPHILFLGTIINLLNFYIID